MKEMFTLQRLQIPATLHKCLATTNIIESLHSGVRRRTHNVSRWRNSAMVERLVASAWLLTEKPFRRIDGHEHLWTLATILGRDTVSTNQEKVAR
jgi:transposase-like protein